MSKENSDVFWVRCVGYNGYEGLFTIGEEYEVVKGCITNDNGYTYGPDAYMKKDSPQDKWFLSPWYRFEIIDDSFPTDDLEISYSDIL